MSDFELRVCGKRKRRKNRTTAIRGGKAVKPNRQNVWCGVGSIADGKRTVRLFYFKPQRALSMRRKIERRVDKDIPSKTLAFSASFAGALRKRTAKHIPYFQDLSINFVPHNYTLCIINYPLFSAFYRKSRPAVWFDSG